MRWACGSNGIRLSPAKAAGWRKSVGLRLLGADLVLSRDTTGEVQALWDYSPHGGVYLSRGKCVWQGYLSCPDHGVTSDGQGECVECIAEGPDSKMVGRLKARVFPTRRLQGMVFVWMGEGELAPIEEDGPRPLVSGSTVFGYDVQTCKRTESLPPSWRAWRTPWPIHGIS